MLDPCRPSQPTKRGHVVVWFNSSGNVAHTWSSRLGSKLEHLTAANPLCFVLSELRRHGVCADAVAYGQARAHRLATDAVAFGSINSPLCLPAAAPLIALVSMCVNGSVSAAMTGGPALAPRRSSAAQREAAGVTCDVAGRAALTSPFSCACRGGTAGSTHKVFTYILHRRIQRILLSLRSLFCFSIHTQPLIWGMPVTRPPPPKHTCVLLGAGAIQHCT